MKTYIQATLAKDNMTQVAWIKNNKNIKVGCEVQLAETGEFWEVKSLRNEIDAKTFKMREKANRSFGQSIKGDN